MKYLDCDGCGEEWVDWAETYAPCPSCNGIGQVSIFLATKQEKKHKKYLKRSYPKPYNDYCIQTCKLRWTDFDTVDSVEWNTIQVVETAAYGLYLVNKMNKECGDYDYCQPY